MLYQKLKPNEIPIAVAEMKCKHIIIITNGQLFGTFQVQEEIQTVKGSTWIRKS